jgi:hypothetical protein
MAVSSLVYTDVLSVRRCLIVRSRLGMYAAEDVWLFDGSLEPSVYILV